MHNDSGDEHRAGRRTLATPVRQAPVERAAKVEYTVQRQGLLLTLYLEGRPPLQVRISPRQTIAFVRGLQSRIDGMYATWQQIRALDVANVPAEAGEEGP